MSDVKPAFLVVLLSVAVVAALVGLTVINYRFSEANPGGNDFLARWMGAYYWVVRGVSPYSQQVSLATQIAIYGRAADREQGENVGHFVYPLTAMVFFAPFGLMDYPMARAVWMTLLEVSLATLAFLSLKIARWRVSPVKAALLVLLTLCGYHGLRTIIVGQFAAVNALLIALVIWLVLKKQDFAAGLILVLAAIKPQMSFLFVPYVLLWALKQKRREIVWGALVGGGALLAATLLLIPDWPLQMIRQILDYPSYTSLGSPLTILANTMPGISRQISIFLHAAFALYLLVEWLISFSKDLRWFKWTVAMTLVVTNLIAFRTATTHYLMMLPAFFMILKVVEERWGGVGKWVSWTFILLSAVGLWVLFLNTVQGNTEAAVMYLPFPFFCLIGLWWTRWWYMKPPKLLFDTYVDYRVS
ncbi:MAG: glycosyltransferase family 87 protein [Anaerolineales bacterium]|nr:glycosyltransferase family 87 protein [Anaerolineales bacterium]